MNNAIYVVNLGTDDAPLCRVGVCALADVPENASLVISSPDASAIFALVRKIVPQRPVKRNTESVVEIALPMKEGIDWVGAACGVERIGKAPFKYEVIKLAGTPDETSWFDRMRIDAFNEQARNVTSSIHNAIAEAVNKGMELEAVFFGGKFAEMSGKPRFTYKIECHNSEDVMVGGTMTFAQDQPGSMLMVSEQEVALRGAGGYNGASHYMNEELDRPMIDALVAFFSRCYKKRL